MRKITLNNTLIGRLDSFNRNYDFNNEPAIETITFVTQTNNLDTLLTLRKQKITDIIINDEETNICTLHNLNGKISYANESINNNNQMVVNVTIKITHTEVSE